MRDALSHMYPSSRSTLYHVVGPLLDPWVYVRALHLLAMFPLGIAYFVSLVTTLSIGIALSWTLIGPPVLLVTMYLSRWAGDGEAWAARHLYGIPLRRPPTTIERGSYRSQVWARLIDPTTWTGLLYLFGQFPIGIIAFVFLVTSTSIAAAAIAAPVVVALGEGVIQIDESTWVIDQPREAWWLPIAGIAMLLLEVHMVNLLSAAHAWWARLMLGSRAPHITPGAPLGDLPTDPGGTHDDLPETSDDPVAPDAAPAPSIPPASPRIVAPQRNAISPASTAQHSSGPDDAVLTSLTPREREVLHLIARGYSNAEIAEAFVVSEGTVKTHVKRVLAKLEVRDRTQAAVWAFDHGFVHAATPPAADEGETREPIQLRATR